jgi:hypothetical protein
MSYPRKAARDRWRGLDRWEQSNTSGEGSFWGDLRLLSTRQLCKLPRHPAEDEFAVNCVAIRLYEREFIYARDAALFTVGSVVVDLDSTIVLDSFCETLDHTPRVEDQHHPRRPILEKHEGNSDCSRHQYFRLSGRD